MGTFEHKIRMARENMRENLHVEGPKGVDAKGGATQKMIEQLRATGFEGSDEEAIQEIARRIRQGTKRDTRDA